MMDTWVSKDGFPVVTITRDDNLFTFKQERFLKDFDYSNSRFILVEKSKFINLNIFFLVAVTLGLFH